MLQVLRDRKAGKAHINKCRCLGISGSCSIQICQHDKLFSFAELGAHLWEIFNNNACNATMATHYQLVPSIGENSVILDVCGDMEIIYTEESPDYCVQSTLYGSVGTAGRNCDPYSNGDNSCENLCSRCGRKYQLITEEAVETCNCEFIYCCEIRCQRCLRTQEHYVCV